MDYFNNAKFSDVIVTLNHQVSLYCHKCILVSNSEFFSAMLTSNFREGSDNEIHLDVKNIDDVVELIKWMAFIKLSL